MPSHPVQAMVAGVEECRHAITILCFSVNPNLRLKQGGNDLGVSSTGGKHERGERGWSHVQRGAALLHLHPCPQHQLLRQAGPADVTGDVEEIHLAHVKEGVEVNLEVVLEQPIGADVVSVDEEASHLHLFRHSGMRGNHLVFVIVWGSREENKD